MNLPRHVGIIMDGNGRWAQKRGLSRIEGHRQGAEVVEGIVKQALKLGVDYISLYSFSTENWKRPKQEVNFLFKLMLNYINSKSKFFLENNVRFKAIGRIWELPIQLQRGFRDLERRTSNFKTMTAVFAVNYGGRQEIIDAVNKILRKKKDYISGEEFKSFLYMPELPDLDLLIRTSGELRISNFLLWQSAYTELYFTKTLWPDFTPEEFTRAIDEFSNRKRTFGGIT